MTISKLGIELIKHFESFFQNAYLCPAGVPTIGWGTITYPDGTDVQMGNRCTRDEAETWLAFELAEKSKAVSKLIEGIDLSQPRFDALVSFAYNLGAYRLQKSTLLKRILQNQDDENITGSQNMTYQEWGRGGQFIKWNKVNGETNKGLIRRRKAESWLYATGMNRFFEEILGDKMATPEDYVRLKKI